LSSSYYPPSFLLSFIFASFLLLIPLTLIPPTFISFPFVFCVFEGLGELPHPKQRGIGREGD
jgi:hypothetical protein